MSEQNTVTRMVPFEVTRATGDGLTLEGYAAVFGSPTMIDSWEGRFAERIKRGAFAKTIRENKPVLQFDHGQHPSIGSIPLGAIEELREDDYGLYVRARMFDNDLVKPVRDAIAGGAINGMSFRFRVIKDEFDEQADWAKRYGDDIPGRTLLEVAMPELGPVVFPAYADTEVGVRNLLVDEVANQVSSTDDEADRQVTSEEAADAPSAEPAPRHSAPETPSRDIKEDVVETPLSVEERAARQSEIKARLAQIDADYNGSALPDEVRSEWDSLDTEYEEHQRAIDEDTRRKERLRALAGSETHTTSGSEPPTVIVRKQATDIYDIGSARNEARSVDDLPAIYRDRALRAIEVSRFPGTKREEAQTRAEELLTTVDDNDGSLAKRMLVTGSPVYERAFGKVATSLSTMGLTAEEQRALSLGTTTEGGFAVPFQLDPTIILTSNGSVNPLRQVARVEQITGKEWQGITSAGVVVSRANEAAEAGDNAPTLAQPSVKAERVQGFIPFSIEIDQDWSQLRSEMGRLLADAKDQEEATSFVTGNGSAPNANGVVATLNASSNVTANTFTAGSVYSLEESLPPRFRDNATFLGNKAVYNLIRQFDTAGGAQLWERIGASTPNQLLGYPAYEVSSMASTVALNARYLLFGDFRHFLIVDRVGMSVELVPHLFGANRRPTGQRGLYAIWRNNSKVLTDNAFRILHKAA
jgi:HK97 family phage major capsid protein/HK97 family phage prohead protease